MPAFYVFPTDIQVHYRTFINPIHVKKYQLVFNSNVFQVHIYERFDFLWQTGLVSKQEHILWNLHFSIYIGTYQFNLFERFKRILFLNEIMWKEFQLNKVSPKKYYGMHNWTYALHEFINISLLAFHPSLNTA